eukprot:TRINITY_DN6555_c0_g1_i2.p1 TRINITY_DN6555_c0_g1~~TRINITY_DN6555_c0_g1_i2.p1  ORF type:complete len:488 (-),score=143.43 TRINITY_DN6555_c0_g1_i2:138-1601(-)
MMKDKKAKKDKTAKKKDKKVKKGKKDKKDKHKKDKKKKKRSKEKSKKKKRKQEGKKQKKASKKRQNLDGDTDLVSSGSESDSSDSSSTSSSSGSVISPEILARIFTSAVEAEDMLRVQFFVRKHGLEWEGPGGNSPIHIVARANKPGIAAWILTRPEAETLIEVRNKKGETPLLLATRLCRGCVAMRLVEAMADPAAADSNGDSPEALDLDGLLREAERDERCRQALKEEKLLAAVTAARRQREEAEFRKRMFDMLGDEDDCRYGHHGDLEYADTGRSDSWMDDIANQAAARFAANTQSLSKTLAMQASAASAQQQTSEKDPFAEEEAQRRARQKASKSSPGASSKDKEGASVTKKTEDPEVLEERRLAARARDEARWQKLEAKVKDADSSTELVLNEADVPWPSGPAENPLRIDPGGHPKVVRSQLRAGLLRWHPDKFEGRFGRLLPPEGKQRLAIMEKVKALAQRLNEQMAGLGSAEGNASSSAA